MDVATQELEGDGDSRYTCMSVRPELKSSALKVHQHLMFLTDKHLE